MSNKKIALSILLSTGLILFLIFSCVVPTFSSFQTGTINQEWDGLVANSFKSGSGTIEDPYIISTPNEFAYFAISMSNEDYEGKYIKLTKDIVINKGVFKENTYIYNDITYYIGNNDKYYADDTLNTLIGNFNIFPIIDGFKGHFDGDFHTIYGLYEKDNSKNALFTNFSGELKNLYVDNAFISGGNITAGVISDANNATVKNIMFQGTVTGKNTVKETTQTIELEDFTVVNSTTKNLNIPMISNLAEIVLEGTCSGTDIFTLNSNEYSCEDFEIEVPNTIEIEAENEAMFTNMSYHLSYEENKTAGIVGIAYNSDLEELVNKGNISGIYTSGIVGTILNTNIKNSYNNGSINGNRSSGIIDTMMYSDNYLRNVYNTGSLETGTKSGLISNVYDSTITVEKSFNTYNTNMINNSVSSNIIVQNSYNVGNDINNDFGEINYETINSFYPKYTNDENIINGNIWVGNEIPILYFDDIRNRTVQVSIDNSSWDSLHTNIQDLKYNDAIEVLISATDMYKPIKNVWYYPSNKVLSQNDFSTVTWTEYNGVFSLNDNVYILYVKYEDYNDNVYYINTDKLIIGEVSVNANIKSGNTLWSTYHNPTNKFYNHHMTYEIVDNGTSLLISNLEYLISTDAMTQEALENAVWTSYSNSITPLQNSYIVYVKVTDTDSNVTYINTDKMIDMSYEVSNLKSGNNLTFSNYMTYNSSFNFNVSLAHIVSIPNYSRYIKVDKQLPNNTKITLKDQNGFYYEYIVTSHNYDNILNGYLYPFADFKKVGKATFDEYFNDESFNGFSNESFNIYVDFKNITSTTNDYHLSVIAKSTELINTKEGQNIAFNLVNTNTNTLSVSSSFNSSIEYGKEHTYNVGLSTSLAPTYYQTHAVTNSLFENLYEGLSIEVYDGQNNIVSRNNLGAIQFIYNNTTYVFNTNNRVNINIGRTHNQNMNLQIITFDKNTDLEGTYYLKIKGYLSTDGINKKYLSTNVVSIPIIFQPNEDFDCSFDVQVSQPIIHKGRNISFDVTYEGELDDPKLRVSLYRKKELTAYNQEYELVDLEEYVSNQLESIGDSIYEFDVNDVVFNILNNVESNGYKFVFELYDDDKKVTEIKIMTIIK